MSSRVLITGAQGFVGRYALAHWLSADPAATIVGIGRSQPLPCSFTHRIEWGDSRFRAPLSDQLRLSATSDRYRYVRTDVRDRAGLIGLLGEVRPSVILHLAGALRDEPASRLFSVNVLGTEALLESIASAGIPPPTVVVGSTGSLYGSVSVDQLPIGEDEPPAPFDLYSASKQAAEGVARILSVRHDIPTIFARIFNVVGPGQDERHLCGWLARQMVAIRVGVQSPLLSVGPLDTTRDFVDVREVARALYLLARHGVPGQAYNVASGIETPTQEIFDQVREMSGLDGGLEIIRRPARPSDCPRVVADIRALRALGYEPAVALRQSLSDVLQYYASVVVPKHERAGRRAAPRAGPSRLTVSNQRVHRYPVCVEAGLLQRLPQRLAEQYPGTRMAVLTDARVHDLYARAFARELQAVGIQVQTVVLAEGEASKAVSSLLDVVGELYRGKFDRRALLINLGGGLVTDVGGFAAAIYMRGVRYVNVPTTLLAQHDAAIGGKVAVNTPWAKNFLGAFHDPDAVYCDTSTLATLEPRALASGVAEAIKVAIIGDPVLFRLLEDEVQSTLEDRDPEVLRAIVMRATHTKIKLLAPDPFERDLRRALNLGHTFGHSLETEMGYERIQHGEAVAYGIAIATAIAYTRGVCSEGTAQRILALLDAYGLPPRVPRSVLLRAIKHVEAIRLVRANQLHFVLPERIGAVQIVPEVSSSEIAHAITLLSEHPVLTQAVEA